MTIGNVGKSPLRQIIDKVVIKKDTNVIVSAAALSSQVATILSEWKAIDSIHLTTHWKDYAVSGSYKYATTDPDGKKLVGYFSMWTVQKWFIDGCRDYNDTRIDANAFSEEFKGKAYKAGYNHGKDYLPF